MYTKSMQRTKTSKCRQSYLKCCVEMKKNSFWGYFNLIGQYLDTKSIHPTMVLPDARKSRFKIVSVDRYLTNQN